MTETDLLWLFLPRVPLALPHVRVFRRNVIRGARVGRSEARISNGIPGQADAYALVRGGRHVELETKAARGALQANQRAWRDFCVSLEIPYLVLRAGRGESEDDTVTRWISELAGVV